MNANRLRPWVALTLGAVVMVSDAPAQSPVAPDAYQRARDKPPLSLSEEQRHAIQSAVAMQVTQQPTPKSFELRVGAEVPKGVKGFPFPRPLIYEVRPCAPIRMASSIAIFW